MLRHEESRRLLRRFGGCLAAGSMIVFAMLATPIEAAATGSTETYLVVYKTSASAQDAASLVQGAGGTLVYNYDQIGVAVARSNRNDFKSKVLADSRVDSVAPTSLGVTRLRNEEPDARGSDSTPRVTPAPGDSLSGLQWDMRQIHAFERSVDHSRQEVGYGRRY